MTRYGAVVTVVTVVVLALTGCRASEPPPPPPTATPTPSASPSASPSAGPSASPSASEPTDPVPESPPVELLAWRPVGGPPTDETVSGGGWTLRVDRRRTRAVLEAPRDLPDVTIRARDGRQVRHALLSAVEAFGFAVVVLTDRRGSRAPVTRVVDLGTGGTSTVDARDELPPAAGTWALHSPVLVHATRSEGRACLAARDLVTGGASVVACPGDGERLTDARVTPAGTTLASVAGDPPCRSLATATGGPLTPVPDVARCEGRESVALTEGGFAWVEGRTARARVGGEALDLGPATPGTLTWCAGATYVVRDPQAGGPGRLVRLDEDGATAIVYESDGSDGADATLSVPRCGGDQLTLDVTTADGVERLTAPLALPPGGDV